MDIGGGMAANMLWTVLIWLLSLAIGIVIYRIPVVNQVFFIQKSKS